MKFMTVQSPSKMPAAAQGAARGHDMEFNRGEKFDE